MKKRLGRVQMQLCPVRSLSLRLFLLVLLLWQVRLTNGKNAEEVSNDLQASVTASVLGNDNLDSADNIFTAYDCSKPLEV